jgi:hypothetical protein
MLQKATAGVFKSDLEFAMDRISLMKMTIDANSRSARKCP